MNSSKTHAALVKVHAKENGDLHEKLKKKASTPKDKLWRFVCQNSEELSVHHDENTGQSSLIVLARLQADKPILIKWGFRLIQP